MSSYQTTYATSSLGIDKKQEPKPLPASAFGSAAAISSSVVVDVPSEVILQGAGNFSFKYDCTGSVGSTGVDGWDTTNVVTNAQDDMALRLPINPCAVSASGDASGTVVSVNFVYKGGL